MRLCVVSFKECWENQDGTWSSTGGFPLQIGAISSLFSETTLIIVRTDPRGGGIPLPAHFRVIPLLKPAGENFRRKLSVIARLPYYISVMVRQFQGADVVHTPLPGDLPLVAWVLAMLLGKRTIVRYGGSWANNAETTFMNRVTRMLMKIVAGGRNVALATGEGEPGPGGKVAWIFSSAISREELASIRPQLNRGLSHPPRLVYVGRLSPEKGVAVLLKALSLYRQKYGQPGLRLLLAGDGPQRAELENLTNSLACKDWVCFLGQLDRDQLSSVLMNSDAAVQPSLTEGYSKAWIDALAHGLPILSSDVGAAGAVIGRDKARGWLVPPGDPAALADTLHKILHEPLDWHGLRRRCREFVESKTIESWSAAIAGHCVRQWKVAFMEGKLQ